MPPKAHRYLHTGKREQPLSRSPYGTACGKGHRHECSTAATAVVSEFDDAPKGTSLFTYGQTGATAIAVLYGTACGKPHRHKCSTAATAVVREFDDAPKAHRYLHAGKAEQPLSRSPYGTACGKRHRHECSTAATAVVREFGDALESTITHKKSGAHH
jgi:hypothetical protein